MSSKELYEEIDKKEIAINTDELDPEELERLVRNNPELLEEIFVSRIDHEIKEEERKIYDEDEAVENSNIINKEDVNESNKVEAYSKDKNNETEIQNKINENEDKTKIQSKLIQELEEKE